MTARIVATNLARRTSATYRAVGDDVRRQREDAGISQRRLGTAAGISQPYVARIEAGVAHPSIETLTAISLALGADLGVRLYPNTGPTIRDATQAAMLEALLRVTHRRWRRFVEVAIQRPSRGVIDLVLHEVVQRAIVALEAQSQIRRLEQQLRWGRAKAEGLRSCPLAARLWPGDPPDDQSVSTALLLRSTRANRDLAVEFEEILRAAYPARTADAVASLTSSDRPWPGAAIIWAVVKNGTATILEQPPRGVAVGR